MYFMRRFVIPDYDSPHHMSDTCVVYLATDRHSDHSDRVAMKFMRDGSGYEGELEFRRQADFADAHVISLLTHYDAETSVAYCQSVKQHDLSMYPYCLVMTATDRGLGYIIISENFAGVKFNYVKMLECRWPRRSSCTSTL